jgi:hypothetical protein
LRNVGNERQWGTRGHGEELFGGVDVESPARACSEKPEFGDWGEGNKISVRSWGGENGIV